MTCEPPRNPYKSVLQLIYSIICFVGIYRPATVSFRNLLRARRVLQRVNHGTQIFLTAFTLFTCLLVLCINFSCSFLQFSTLSEPTCSSRQPATCQHQRQHRPRNRVLCALNLAFHCSSSSSTSSTSSSGKRSARTNYRREEATADKYEHIHSSNVRLSSVPVIDAAELMSPVSE